MKASTLKYLVLLMAFVPIIACSSGCKDDDDDDLPLLLYIDADFSATPLTGPAPLTVQFVNESSAGAPIESYNWDFGDGNTSVEENPLHTYTEIGTYDVSLTVTTDYNENTETKLGYITTTPLFLTLRAQVYVKSMADGTTVTMWGYAMDSEFGVTDGTVSSPGPVLEIPHGTRKLVISLDNNLSVPTSLVINSQSVAASPVRLANGRVRSFTHETAPGNTTATDYEWDNPRPGTYLYSSGTHPAVQVQMGLYGAMTIDFDSNMAYDGIPYDNEIMLLFSEIDPTLHAAVAADDFGPGKTVTSTIDYRPEYFLINGETFTTTNMLSLPTGAPGQRSLVRMVNAGLLTHAPVINGLYMETVAEDGYKYNYPKYCYAQMLDAGKTKDIILAPENAGTYVLFDRRLYLRNGLDYPGGMMVYLEVNP